jgi:hypothetical protein
MTNKTETVEISLEVKKEMLSNWIKQYISKFFANGVNDNAEAYTYLMCAIDFASTKKSIEKVEHLFNIRNTIEKHIQDNNFDNNYKKLNEKLVYNMAKAIKNIILIDCKVDVDISRVAVFDTQDLEIVSKEENIEIANAEISFKRGA